MTLKPTFASRLNSFAARPELYWPAGHDKPNTLALLERAAQVPGLTHVDLNYPDHLASLSVEALRDGLMSHDLTLNGFAMRYYTNPAFSLGAFTHPDRAIRQQAIDLAREGIDQLVAAGGHLMTIWLGQDGYDYPFQADYQWLWQQEIDAIRQVARHNPAVQISIEYKPNEPRAFSVLPDMGTTLLAIRAVGLPNMGVTLDFCHMLIAGEQPANAAALAVEHSQLLGLHLNDGYGPRDDGLMVGSVHLPQTLELLYYLKRFGYEGTIYFDTFPHNEDPVAECTVNIEMVQRLIAMLDRLDETELQAIFRRQDAVAAQRLLHRLLLG